MVIRIKDTPILITNYDFRNVSDFSKFVESIIPFLNGARGLILFGEEFSIEVLKLIIDNSKKNLNIVPIRAKYLSIYEYEDAALFTNSRFIDKDREMKLASINADDFGFGCEFDAGTKGFG